MGVRLAESVGELPLYREHVVRLALGELGQAALHLRVGLAVLTILSVEGGGGLSGLRRGRGLLLRLGGVRGGGSLRRAGGRLLLVINWLLLHLQIGLLLVGVLQLLLLLVVEVVLALGRVHGCRGVVAHHLILGLRVHVVHVGGLREVAGRGGGHGLQRLPILASDLMVLHLLNYLLHVLTCVLQLRKLLLEPVVEGLEGDHFLGVCHRLDTCQQVVRHVVGSLENVVLLEVDLPHAWVLNLID